MTVRVLVVLCHNKDTKPSSSTGYLKTVSLKAQISGYMSPSIYESPVPMKVKFW